MLGSVWARLLEGNKDFESKSLLPHCPRNLGGRVSRQ